MKHDFRRIFRGELARRDAADLQARWRRLAANVLAFCREELALPPGAVVALFGGLPDEADLWTGLHAEFREAGWPAALFALRQDAESGGAAREMTARVVEGPAQALRGRFGNWEPAADAPAVEPGTLAAVCVPGLFFCAETGARLGRGGGYFDRYLERVPEHVPRVGVALSWQLRCDFPTEAHDQAMHWVVTEEGWRACRSCNDV